MAWSLAGPPTRQDQCPPLAGPKSSATRHLARAGPPPFRRAPPPLRAAAAVPRATAVTGGDEAPDVPPGATLVAMFPSKAVHLLPGGRHQTQEFGDPIGGGPTGAATGGGARPFDRAPLATAALAAGPLAFCKTRAAPSRASHPVSREPNSVSAAPAWPHTPESQGLLWMW